MLLVKILAYAVSPFPQSEFELNAENVTAAKSLLGGPDNAATNVWWDKKSK